MKTSARIPLLERRASSMNTDLVLDIRRSLPEDVSIRSKDSYSASSFTPFSHENFPLSEKPHATGTGKRWGIFGSKKPEAETIVDTVTPQSDLTKKRSKLLRKKSLGKPKPLLDLKPLLSPEDLGKVNAYYAPAPELPATPHLCSHGLPPLSIPRDNVVPTEASSAALYFTVDPSWDASKGGAELYILAPTANRQEAAAFESPHKSATSAQPHQYAKHPAGNYKSFLSMT